MQALEHPLLLRGELGDDAMKEQGGLVEQPFRGFNAFDDNAAGQDVQAGVFFGRQVFAGKYNHRQIAKCGSLAKPL